MVAASRFVLPFCNFILFKNILNRGFDEILSILLNAGAEINS